METEYIKLGIAGNPYSNGGHQPLISIGYEDAVLRKDIVFPSPVKSDFFIQFMQTEDEMQYTYVADPNTIHSIGASRAGSLWISITVPKGISIKGYTPYTLLMKIVDMFHRHYMTQRSDGSYEFRPGNYDRKVFVDFIAQLETEEHKGRYVAMTGDKPGAVATGNKMEEFFADPQYPEFSNYSKIIVAKKVDGSKIDVGIPRPVNYTVYHRSQKIGTITSRTEVFEHTFESPDDDHEDSTVTFSLEDKGRNVENCQVLIDEKNESINLIPTFAEKTFRFELEYDIPEDFIYAGAEFYMHTASGQKITLPGLESKVRQIEISGADFCKEFSFGSTLPSDFKLDCTLDRNLKKISLKITKVPKIESIKLNFKISEKATWNLIFNDSSSELPLIDKEGVPFQIKLKRSILKENFKGVKLTSDNYDYTLKQEVYKNNEVSYSVEAKPKKTGLNEPIAHPSDSRLNVTDDKVQPSGTLKIINGTNDSHDVDVTVIEKRIEGEFEIENRLKTKDVRLGRDDEKTKEFPIKQISEVLIEFKDAKYLPVTKKDVKDGMVTLEQDDLKTGCIKEKFLGLFEKNKTSYDTDCKKNQRLSNSSFKEIFPMVIIVLAVITIGIIFFLFKNDTLKELWDNLVNQNNEMTEIENLLKDIPEIQCTPQKDNIYILSNWDEIFGKYTKAQNSSVSSSVREKLDLADYKINQYKNSNNLDKRNKNVNRKLENMENKYKDKKESYDSVIHQTELQISWFSNLMKELKMGNYELLFNDVENITDWIEKAKKCNLIDTNNDDYKFVEKYYSDFKGAADAINTIKQTKYTNKSEYDKSRPKTILQKISEGQNQKQELTNFRYSIQCFYFSKKHQNFITDFISNHDMLNDIKSFQSIIDKRKSMGD